MNDAPFLEGNSSIKYHVSPYFSEEIDKVLKNQMVSSNQVKARDFTPNYLVKNGAKDLPMLITQRHIRTIVYTEAEARQLGLPIGSGINYHGLGKALLVKAIDSMDSPTEVYKKDADNFIIVTKLLDANGDTIIVPVKINGKGTYNNVYIDENHITSVYGKKNLQNYLQKNNFTKIDIKEGTALNEGVQYSNISNSSTDSISQKTQNTTKISEKVQNQENEGSEMVHRSTQTLDDLPIKPSLSTEGQQDMGPVGNYNVYGRDVMLDGDIGPVREDIPSVERCTIFGG